MDPGSSGSPNSGCPDHGKVIDAISDPTVFDHDTVIDAISEPTSIAASIARRGSADGSVGIGFESMDVLTVPRTQLDLWLQLQGIRESGAENGAKTDLTISTGLDAEGATSDGGNHHAEGKDPEMPRRQDKAVACPRCHSLETRFCYYNNYNIKQPRHFCKQCERYWSVGGTLRDVPVGAGRRRNKHGSVVSPRQVTEKMATIFVSE